MKIRGFIWLEEIVDKLWRKHRVTQAEVVELFHNAPQMRFVERGYRAGEDVYSALGQSWGGRFLIVFFVYKHDRQALIVSAREMTAAERKKHEQK